MKELSTRLVEETSLKHDAEDRFTEAKQRRNAAHEELALLSRQLKEVGICKHCTMPELIPGVRYWLYSKPRIRRAPGAF